MFRVDHQPITMLEEAICALGSGSPVPAVVASWLANGLRGFLERGTNLEIALGLAVRQGGRYERAHAAKRLRERNDFVRTLAAAIPGDLSQRGRAGAVVAILTGRAVAPNDSTRQAAEELTSRFGPELPLSQSQIVRILSCKLRTDGESANPGILALQAMPLHSINGELYANTTD